MLVLAVILAVLSTLVGSVWFALTRNSIPTNIACKFKGQTLGYLGRPLRIDDPAVREHLSVPEDLFLVPCMSLKRDGIEVGQVCTRAGLEIQEFGFYCDEYEAETLVRDYLNAFLANSDCKVETFNLDPNESGHLAAATWVFSCGARVSASRHDTSWYVVVKLLEPHN